MPQDELSSANETESQVTDTIAEPSAGSTDPAVPAAEPPADSPATVEEVIKDADLDAAKAAWEEQADPTAATVSEADLQRASELAEPFVGQWNQLISTTNWEKGRIISLWRNELIESGVDATQYSDDAWSRRVGGVTAPHVGRLRRVYERFNDSYQSYQGLYWSHFLAALDWEDAPLWLEGAANEKWSISVMREKRWQAEGAVDSNRPTDSQIVEVDTDEDVTLPAQGDGKNREYDNDSGGVESGPTFEGPDFGDEEELQSLAGQNKEGEAGIQAEGSETEAPAAPVQPFIGLPQLPNDLNEAIESLKLAILRHKAAEWRDVEVDVVERYLQAVGVMLRS
ncbi:hypothetical protein Enr13x_34060 [Stieleria neptunia]|uniref:Uncharacterized protein n=1 Tax=Stieleria neptunia TaxID=2527979 RepID=A0A518HRS5_9BACT|nr:hypothetical protein [Stieleria neptunia]QDV43549.1 hypothetical protein Enr13x_34060 [Stieleria neptunia]